MNSSDVKLTAVRKAFHASLLETILTVSGDVVSIADKSHRQSRAIALELVRKLGYETGESIKRSGQTQGQQFEHICREFIDTAFSCLRHVRPGDFKVSCVTSRRGLALSEYQQYEHLRVLSTAISTNAELAAALGNEYAITPDIVVTHQPLSDATINLSEKLVDDEVARRTSLREINNPNPILHASISCKWTLRTDRAQNARSEALNLIRNRKGRLPHVMVVTAEPTPARIASLALGTGDIDCVYHMALPELQEVIAELGFEDAQELLSMMVEGRRLRDIADLPLDLAV